MRALAILLALILLSNANHSTAQTPQNLEPPSDAMRLPSGERVSTWGAVSYNKLRRGTALEVEYDLFIQPDACFFVGDKPSEGQQGLKIVISASPGLETAVVQQTKREKRSVIRGVKIANCNSCRM